jgi:hypothetical protein
MTQRPDIAARKAREKSARIARQEAMLFRRTCGLEGCEFLFDQRDAKRHPFFCCVGHEEEWVRNMVERAARAMERAAEARDIELDGEAFRGVK